MNKQVVILGAGGHAEVVADIIEKSGDKVIRLLDNNDEIEKYKNTCSFIIAIGDNYLRKKLATEFNYLKWYTAIHPSAQIGKNVKIECGSMIMAEVVVNPGATIGNHTIINTGAIVEHDNKIGNFVHISPRVVLGGTVTIGECSHIGIGASVSNNINITSNVVVGAGAVVVKNIEKRGTYVGVPAKELNALMKMRDKSYEVYKSGGGHKRK